MYSSAGMLTAITLMNEVLWLSTHNTAPVYFRFYVQNHLYSPVALAHYSGFPLERYEYDAYGNPTI
jgi:hypothetical protein